MKDLLNKLNQANRVMNTANRTVYNVSETKRNVNRLTGNAGTRTKPLSENARNANSAVSDEWKCECGKKMSSKFCDNCGSSKPACPGCGADVSGKNFCPECGTRLS